MMRNSIRSLLFGCMTNKLLRSSRLSLLQVCQLCASQQPFSINTDKLDPKLVVIVSKLTRYGYERIKNHELDEEELQSALLERGSDYYTLKARHNRHEEIVGHVVTKLQERGIETRVVPRAEYSHDSIKEADLVISAGGDGTFLLAASKIKKHDLPLIGVNTDPERSEGYLCINRKFSYNFGEALDHLLTQGSNRARWLSRKRIRITMSGKHENDEPIQLLEQQLLFPEQRFSEHIREHELHHSHSKTIPVQPNRVLPILALNDVFIGECLSARVSHYDRSINGSPYLSQKSSGITICTGTGSSSWYFNINCLQPSDVRTVLKITNEKIGSNIPYEDADLVECIVNRFNKSLYFSPTLCKMAYTVRDPIRRGVFQVAEPKGFAERMAIRSKMWDGCLVIDGGVSYKFNDGAEARLEMLNEDDLTTVLID